MSRAVKAILLDLDGVITNTQKVHFKAWEKVFNSFLGECSFTFEDYLQLVDGKPREAGIISYLTSRGIDIEDSKVKQISEQKNDYYLNELEQNPPELFPDFSNFLIKWKSSGTLLGVVSSSKNCKLILQKLRIEEAFHVRVDGEIGRKRSLKGKPAPDYFLEAAKELGVEPSDCALVEDSLAGVEAGRKGKFRIVYGMKRDDKSSVENFYDSGADFVINSLEQIGVTQNALTSWNTFKDRIKDREVALFLDFDGTLSEIVSRPDDASILSSAKYMIEKISDSIRVAIVSGRDRLDVKKRVDISGIFYAGCHGLDISGPGCFHFLVEEAKRSLPELNDFSSKILKALESINGVTIERKQFATAVHYRQVEEKNVEIVMSIVHELLKKNPFLKFKEGKKVIEVLPDIQWGKGEAVKKLFHVLQVDPAQVVPIYIGDDETDEDAFKALYKIGVGIKVGEDVQNTDAHFCLSSPFEVVKFLELMKLNFYGEEKRWKRGG